MPYRGEQRTHHEYVLTEAGSDLLPVLNALLLWGEKHTASPHPGEHMGIIHSCGAESTSSDVCSGCGAELQSDRRGVAATVAGGGPAATGRRCDLTA